MVDGKFTDEALQVVSLLEETEFNRTDLMEVIESTRQIALKIKSKGIHFDDETAMTDTDYKNLLGINKIDFENICSHVKHIRNTKVRSYRTCIGILLTKLRSGMSNRFLSTIFNISVNSIKKALSSARQALSVHFTPNYIGFQHITREAVISNHTRKLAQTLFGDLTYPAILVIDGTYIYIQKSGQFEFQRRCFSLHKKRPLVKPLMITTTTGYIVSVFGPYFSDTKNNDANILKHAFNVNLENMKEWLQENDVIIVDRGFRDSLAFLKNLGLTAEMPAYLYRGNKQHETQESNASRLITKIRWVVEAVNRKLKLWKYFENIVPNTQIPYLCDYIRLVCDVLNKYTKPVSTTADADESLGCRMLYLAKQSNNLREKVELNKWDKVTVARIKINDAEFEFPKLDEEDLRNITLGVYQLKLAKLYTKEHLNKDGRYELMVHQQQSGIIMAKIQSRHVSSKVYKLWLEYDELTVNGWCCQCRSGSRMMGTCAHIASIIWYLGFARHEGISFSSETDLSMFLSDAKAQPETNLDETAVEE